MSRVFTDTYSKDFIGTINADEVLRGGTGYNLANTLPVEVEHIHPDYTIYPQFAGTAYGFEVRVISAEMTLFAPLTAHLAGGTSPPACPPSLRRGWKRKIKLLDANLLACPDHEKLLIQLAESRAWVDFTQGLDVRLITPDNVALLNRVKTKAVHFAWDNPDDDLTAYFERFVALTNIKSDRRRRVYVLTNYGSTHEQDLYRINTLRGLGYDPYVMVFDRPTAPPITRKLQRWVNNKRIFYTVPRFEDYDPTWRKPK